MSATLTNTTNNQPFILYAISNRPPGSSSSSSNSSGSGSGAKNSRDPIQIICPYTGSNLTSTHSLRTPTSSSNKNAFGIQCLLPVPLTNMMGSSGLGGGDDDDGNSLVFIGHGGSYTSNNNNNKNGGKDDYAFLLSRLSSSSSSSNNNNNNNPKWKVRCPQPFSKTFQSISISSNGRYVAAGTTSGSILLWDWTLSNGDNLINVWKGHYRSISCVLFNEEGNMLFSGGEDGVVNAWNVLDLIDIDNNNNGGSNSSVHPFQTWSEHSLPITSLCVLSGGGSTTRLVSSSLDRNIILMELGCSGNGMIGTSNNNSNGRTLARICLPSGIHTVITNHATTSSSSCCSQRLYCGAHDGNVYCIDLDKFALHETITVGGTSSSSYNSGTTTVVNVNQSDSSGATATRRRNMKNEEDNFESLLMGSHVLLPSSSNNNNNYTCELKGHVKAVTSLALLDPSSLLLNNNSATNILLASDSDDGTLRIWDLNSRSCIKVLRPWSTTTSSSSSVGGVSSSSSSVSSSSSPPITGIIVVPKSSLSSSSSFGGGGINTTLISSSSRSRRGSSNAHGSGDITSLFKPLKSFLRGTSVIQNSDTNDNDTESGKEGECITPILWPRRDDVQFWDETIKSSRGSEHDNDDDGGGRYNTISRKRAKYNSDGVHVDDDEDGDKTDQEEEITRLKKELAESQTVIKRWEAVNNQLITKLKNDNK